MAQQVEEQLVSMTERAVEKALALLHDRGTQEMALRVFVAGGGCSGYQYGMAIPERQEENDIVIGQGPLRLFIDPESAPLLRGAEIDFIDDVMRSGFSISNPNATGACECGSSFRTEDGGCQPKGCC
jgi:iron-sulfur cluster assembly protein